MRLPVIAANWKMFKTAAEARDFLDKFTGQVLAGNTEVIICPPFTLLCAVAERCRQSGLKLGAQNMFWQMSGPYTGEVSPGHLADLGVQYVILGHSERRQHFGETDEDVSRKVRAAFAADLTPIVCVGETWTERLAGETARVVRGQLAAALRDLDPSQVRRAVVAYEPVWAIGSGQPATRNDAEQVALELRRQIGEQFSLKVARDVRIQYGGSVNPENIRDFLGSPEIDGALVGGASLDPGSFAALVNSIASEEAL